MTIYDVAMGPMLLIPVAIIIAISSAIGLIILAIVLIFRLIKKKK